MKWKTKEGKWISIVDMDNTHIVNSMFWLIQDPCFGNLEKDGYGDRVWVEAFTEELKDRVEL